MFKSREISNVFISKIIYYLFAAFIFLALSPRAQAFCMAGDSTGPHIGGITLRNPSSLANFEGDIVSGRVRADIGASDPSGLHTVNWFIDDVFVKSFTYSLHKSDSYLVFNSSRLQSGSHVISVEIIDGCGLSSRFDRPFEVQ